MNPIREFDSYDPSAWQEEGLLISLPDLPVRPRILRHVAWIAALSLNYFVVLNGTVSIPGNRSQGNFASSMREQMPSASDVDDDLVPPGYWTHVNRLARRMPQLPPEVSEPDPDLPDFDL